MFSFTKVLTNEMLSRMIARAFPGHRPRECIPMSGGLINSNLKIEFESQHDPVVLRLYRDGGGVCRKEIALYELLAKELRVPRVLHADFADAGEFPPYAILEYIEGVTFQQLKQTKNFQAIQQAALSVGKTLAAIGRCRFRNPGSLVVSGKPGKLEVGPRFIEGPDSIPRLLDRFLANELCQRRAGTQLVKQIHEFGWAWSAHLPDLDEQPCLVHADFGNRNILVREENGEWVVAAVIDWEFAFSGSPLLDVGHFLRYERSLMPLREPHFSGAYVEHGGKLPDNWREIVRVIDLTGLVENLTHADLPVEVAAEFLKLIKATLRSVKMRSS